MIKPIIPPVIDINVVCEIPGPVTAEVRRLVALVFSRENIPTADCTVVFTDDEYLSRLKQEFFGKNQLTDVIAFRLNSYNDPHPEGEIYISLTRAAANAVEFSEPYSREVARLVVHGCLHLLGQDDSTDAEKTAMRAAEEQYLNQFEWHKVIAESDDL